MCTAVDGGSIHRAARRISAASDQTSTPPITSHRTKDRRKPLRSGVLGGVSGFSVTFQNTSLWLGCRLCLVLRAPTAPPAPSLPKTLPGASSSCTARIPSSSPVSSAFPTSSCCLELFHYP